MEESPKKRTGGSGVDPTKKKKPSRSAEGLLAKKECDKRRRLTRICIGVAFPRWRALKKEIGLRSDTDVALILLDNYQTKQVTSDPHKQHSQPLQPIVSNFKEEPDHDRGELLIVGGQKEDAGAEEVGVLEARIASCTCESMCSVVGCDSWHRRLQHNKLPEDPDRRLEWVQFLFEVNGQRLQESSWTDITICSEHFTDDCFDFMTKTGKVQLKPSAVPSLSLKSKPSPVCKPGPEEPEPYQTVSDSSTSRAVSEIVAVIEEEGGPTEEREESGDEGTDEREESGDEGTDEREESGDEGTDETEESADESTDETEESGDEGGMDSGGEGNVRSDNDWKPGKKHLLAKRQRKNTPNEEGKNEKSPSQLCTDCGKFTRWKSHMCEHKIKPYSCNICGTRCVSEVALNSHSRIHNENYEYRCKFCHATFKTKVGKQKHEQTHMNEEKRYKCTECSETFATNKERKSHLEDHTGPPQLKCHICGMEFPYPLSLQRHLTVHTGERPFKCSVCQRGFKQASHLKSHMRLHTGERPFKCQHCDKCFNHNVSLKSHIQRYHTSNSGCEQTKENINEKEHDTGDGEGNQTGADSGLDNVEKKQDTEEEMQGICRTKTNGKSTGRPKGRPKTYESSNLVLAVQVEGQCSKSKTRKPKMQKSKRTQCSDEESEDDLSDSDMAFDSAQEEEERSKTVIKNMSSRGRSKKPDSDSDFDPGERNKKRYSSHNSGKSLRKRPRKNHVE